MYEGYPYSLQHSLYWISLWPSSSSFLAQLSLPCSHESSLASKNTVSYIYFLDYQIKKGYLVRLSEHHFPEKTVLLHSTSLKPASKASPLLTFLHSLRIRNLNAVVYLAKKWYLCIEMSGKGSISRMSDECLMKLKSGSLYFGEYQAGMRKFTLAGKSSLSASSAHHLSRPETKSMTGALLSASPEASKSIF